MTVAATSGACMQAESTAQVQSSISSENRLALNRLALNRLALNRLALNRLALNRLALNQLALNQLALDDLSEAEVEDTERLHDLLSTADGRDVFKYAVRCAFEYDDVVSASVDGATYEFAGQLGLAPKWDEHALSESERGWMSSCLLAHVNAYGVSVSISLRAHGELGSTDEERADYPVYEGTFFGDLFDEDAKMYACQGSVKAAATAHSEDRELRACTEGTEDCAIVSVGRCRDVCEKRHFEEGWSECWAEGVRYDEAISVYLFADDPAGGNQSCTDDQCVMQNSGGPAIMDCGKAKNCAATCDDGATCSVNASKSDRVHARFTGVHAAEVDCYKGEACSVECTAGSACDVECQAGRDCNVQCTGSDCDVDCYDGQLCDVSCEAGASCHVECGGKSTSCDDIVCRDGADCSFECRDALNCDFATCEDGASCMLSCTEDAANCGFAECEGGATECGNGVVVCGRECP
ncbi:hypothetical protein [Haliangium ochraceum]|nr:hypothetical protein [Haliangium ochraceum]